MKTYQREIIIFILAALATAVAVGYFFSSMTREKVIVQTNLTSVIASDPIGLLLVNKPSVFSRLMLSQPQMYKAFSKYIPNIYLTIIQKKQILPQIIFSFHRQGVVMYMKIDGGEAYLIDKEILNPAFNMYSPQRQTLKDITFTFYPAPESRFLGCYQYNGIWVASYSKRLLEEAALKQLDQKDHQPKEIKEIMQKLDKNAPISLMFPTQELNLFVHINDSTEWRIQDKWQTTEIFTSKGDLCAMSSQPFHAELDSFYHLMVDTINLRLSELFPSLQINTQIDQDDHSVYFSINGEPTHK